MHRRNYLLRRYLARCGPGIRNGGTGTEGPKWDKLQKAEHPGLAPVALAIVPRSRRIRK